MMISVAGCGSPVGVKPGAPKRKIESENRSGPMHYDSGRTPAHIFYVHTLSLPYPPYFLQKFKHANQGPPAASVKCSTSTDLLPRCARGAPVTFFKGELPRANTRNRALTSSPSSFCLSVLAVRVLP